MKPTAQRITTTYLNTNRNCQDNQSIYRINIDGPFNILQSGQVKYSHTQPNSFREQANKRQSVSPYEQTSIAKQDSVNRQLELPSPRVAKAYVYVSSTTQNNNQNRSSPIDMLKLNENFQLKQKDFSAIKGNQSINANPIGGETQQRSANKPNCFIFDEQICSPSKSNEAKVQEWGGENQGENEQSNDLKKTNIRDLINNISLSPQKLNCYVPESMSHRSPYSKKSVTDIDCTPISNFELQQNSENNQNDVGLQWTKQQQQTELNERLQNQQQQIKNASLEAMMEEIQKLNAQLMKKTEQNQELQQKMDQKSKAPQKDEQKIKLLQFENIKLIQTLREMKPSGNECQENILKDFNKINNKPEQLAESQVTKLLKQLENISSERDQYRDENIHFFSQLEVYQKENQRLYTENSLLKLKLQSIGFQNIQDWINEISSGQFTNSLSEKPAVN